MRPSRSRASNGCGALAGRWLLATGALANKRVVLLNGPAGVDKTTVAHRVAASTGSAGSACCSSMKAAGSRRADDARAAELDENRRSCVAARDWLARECSTCIESATDEEPAQAHRPKEVRLDSTNEAIPTDYHSWSAPDLFVTFN